VLELHGIGASATAAALYNHFGINADTLVGMAHALLAERNSA
jgi:hypothetical protein